MPWRSGWHHLKGNTHGLPACCRRLSSLQSCRAAAGGGNASGRGCCCPSRRRGCRCAPTYVPRCTIACIRAHLQSQVALRQWRAQELLSRLARCAVTAVAVVVWCGGGGRRGAAGQNVGGTCRHKVAAHRLNRRSHPLPAAEARATAAHLQCLVVPAALLLLLLARQLLQGGSGRRRESGSALRSATPVQARPPAALQRGQQQQTAALTEQRPHLPVHASN